MTLEELERAVADDDAAWTVLEDWLLENEDPRAALVRLAQEEPHDEVFEREQLLPLLLGPEHETLANGLNETEWRAGYLTECRYTEPARDSDAMTTALFASPAMRVVRSISFDVASVGRLATQLRTLAMSPCMRSVRTLQLHARHADPGFLDAALLAFDKLTALHVTREVVLRGRLRLPALERLSLVGGTPSWFGQSYPSLRTFRLDLRDATFDPDVLVKMPALDTLHLLFDTRDATMAAYAALSKSDVRKQLTSVWLEDRRERSVYLESPAFPKCTPMVPSYLVPSDR